MFAGVGEGVGVGVATGDGLGDDVPPLPVWTARCTPLARASSELNMYASVLMVSSASERKDPAPAATVGVKSTSSQVEIGPFGVTVVIVAPFAGRLL
jgi:hypothetical protein